MSGEVGDLGKGEIDRGMGRGGGIRGEGKGGGLGQMKDDLIGTPNLLLLSSEGREARKDRKRKWGSDICNNIMCGAGSKYIRGSSPLPLASCSPSSWGPLGRG